MTTRLLPKTALATLAAVSLLLPFGAPLPGSCLRAIGVAGAAPSPSCGGDLRECLRQSADLRQTTFGGRYVTADDVAKCMEAFRSCSSGGASRGGNQSGGGAIPPGSTSEAGVPAPTDSSSDNRGGNASPPRAATEGDGSGSSELPERFGVTWSEDQYTVTQQCLVNGNAVNCSGTVSPLPPGTDSLEAKFTGVLSGLTATGTRTGRTSGSGDCPFEANSSNSMNYGFKPDGTLTIRQGPGQSFLTTCTGPDIPRDYPASESTGTWSPIS